FKSRRRLQYQASSANHYELRGRDYLAHGRLMRFRFRYFRNTVSVALCAEHLGSKASFESITGRGLGGACLAARQVAGSSMTCLFLSTRRVPFEVSRMTSTLSQGSATTAQRPIWILNGPLRTLPPAEVNLARASGTESTTRSVSIGRSPLWSTSSALEPGSFRPAALLLRQISSCPRFAE